MGERWSDYFLFKETNRKPNPHWLKQWSLSWPLERSSCEGQWVSGWLSGSFLMVLIWLPEQRGWVVGGWEHQGHWRGSCVLLILFEEIQPGRASLPPSVLSLSPLNPHLSLASFLHSPFSLISCCVGQPSLGTFDPRCWLYRCEPPLLCFSYAFIFFIFFSHFWRQCLMNDPEVLILWPLPPTPCRASVRFLKV